MINHSANVVNLITFLMDWQYQFKLEIKLYQNYVVLLKTLKDAL